jgi:beta-glucosidase
VNGQLLIDQWKKQSYRSSLRDFYFEKGKAYDLRVEFFEPVGNAKIKLIWSVGVKNDCEKKINEAMNAARQSDVAVVVCGIQEGEFQDRAMLSLPGHQEEMINKIAEAGKPVVVVLIGGSAVVMSKWLDNIDGILDAWYPGEEGGHAIASVLFGDYNPAGRLPITFPVHEAQLPLVYNHKPTGRGDDYNNLSGEPLFPFGFGLSYTRFEYSKIRLDKPSISSSEPAEVSITVGNSGTLEGDEVIQLYIKDEFASVARPVMELKGFKRIHLRPGETQEVGFTVNPTMLSMLDKKMQRVVESGVFRIMIGASSKDIRQVIDLEVK